LDII
jgi:hypothetical protein